MNRSTILIIEDEVVNIEILVEMLTKKYELKVAYDGLMGIKIAKKILPDIILLDIEMPKMDGFEVVYELKNCDDTKDIPIIFVTSKTHKEVIITALNSGAVDYIIKPYFKEELKTRIANHLKTRLLQKELNNRNKIQEQLLIQQSKLASMGEMIGAVAHQWRQPLTSLGGILTNIEESYEEGKLSSDYLEKQIDTAEKNIMYMSKTIDDFRNFFVPSKYKEPFSVSTAVINAISIIDDAFKNSEINIIFSINQKKINDYKDKKNNNLFLVNGYANEFSQVIINILQNSKDAILENINFIEDKNIFVDISSDENSVKIVIKDSAKGIPTSIINRIFEPYFTTKEEGKGTGIGLYMSRMIIETNMQGKLNVSNYENGAIFEINMKKLVNEKNINDN